MSKLDEIVSNRYTLWKSEEETKQAIKDLFKELVDEDEFKPSHWVNPSITSGVEMEQQRARDRFRKELREKIKEL